MTEDIRGAIGSGQREWKESLEGEARSILAVLELVLKDVTTGNSSALGTPTQ